MKIKNLGIGSFGKLSDVSINLDKRMTVIYGKNEAGKSTISSFIRYMMYGFSQKRSTSLSENDRKKYTPWHSDEIWGQMLFEDSQKNVYTAVRKNAARAQSSIFDSNNMPVFQGQSVGDVFLGISEQCYKKTAFVGQKDILFSDQGELEDAINNIMSSADENIDTSKALKKLEDMRKFLLGKTARSGKIYDIAEKLKELQEEKEKWQNGHKELLESESKLIQIKQKISFNQEKLSEIEKQIYNAKCLEAKNKLETLSQARDTALQSKDEFENLFKSMQKGDFVPDRKFYDYVSALLGQIDETNKKKDEFLKMHDNAKDALDSIYKDDKLKSLSQKIRSKNTDSGTLLNKVQKISKSRKKSLVIAVLFSVLIVTLPIAIIFYIKNAKLNKQIKNLLAEYGFDSVKAFTNALEKDESCKAQIDFAVKTLGEVEEKISQCDLLIDNVLEKLVNVMQKATDDVALSKDEVADRAVQYLDLLSEWLQKLDAAKQKCNEDYVRYNTLASSQDETWLKSLAEQYDKDLPIRDATALKQEKSFYSQANQALEIKERELEKKSAVITGTLPKPAEIQSTIESLSSQKQDLEQKHTALELAIQTLQKASDNMKQSATPAIAEFSGNMFKNITSGKYKGLYTDNQMNLTFLEANGAQVRDCGYLSAGTLDAAYISLRMALCTYLCKEEPVIVFDDAFSNLDDERLGNMLEFLYSLSDKFQIVILTCHKREAEFLKDRAKIINFEVN